MIAGMLAAYVSTLVTHLNWGSSYLVHDFYRRFVTTDAEERHYVAVGRWITAVLMVIAALLTYVLDTAQQAFQLLLSIGAGTGLIYLLRWFWWRINAWCEIAAMISSFVVALGLFIASKQGMNIPSHITLLITIGTTTIVWVTTALITAPTDRAVLVAFYRQGSAGRPRVGIRSPGDRAAAVTRFPATGLPGLDLRCPDGLRRAVRHRFAHLRTHHHRRVLDCRLRGERIGAAPDRPENVEQHPGRFMSTRATRAVVLAGGLGSRMRREEAGVVLDGAQRAAAERGLKAMMPDARGRPFLEHILASLADGGVTDVCLVVPPAHEEIIDWHRSHPLARLRLGFAVQVAPLGTANALLAAESWLEGQDFITLNADNLYPVSAIQSLVTLGEPGLVAFDAKGLVASGNIEAERLAAFAILELRDDGTLARIIEKPSAEERARAGDHPWISMNIWRLDATIFSACRDVSRSTRGEFELPQAVGLAITRGARFRAVRMSAPVLDLSRRGDVAALARHLATLPANP